MELFFNEIEENTRPYFHQRENISLFPIMFDYKSEQEGIQLGSVIGVNAEGNSGRGWVGKAV